MRPTVLGAALGVLLSGCVMYQRAYAPPPGGAPAPVASRLLSEQEAADVGFRLCHDRALRVDRVDRARLDTAGRWHLRLAGFTDRAQLLLDGRDGRLLKGRFYREDSVPPGASPSQTPPALPEREAPPPPPEWPDFQ